MTRLSVNINKIALIRNSRRGNLPDLVQIAKDCERFGAEGITVHPRPDQRHIRFTDIPDLRKVVSKEFNIEGYPSKEFIKLVCDNTPDQVTLVPDAPEVLTSESGWDVISNRNQLIEIIQQFKEHKIRVSLFLDPDPEMVYAAKETGADRVEFYTGDYSKNYQKNQQLAILDHQKSSIAAKNCMLGINAGHDLNLENLKYYKMNIEGLLEVSIGHALVCDAIYFGLENAIQMYKNLLK